jgi:hypothetical protein
MVTPDLFHFTIGRARWKEDIHKFTVGINPNYWNDFVASTPQQLEELSEQLGRRLPDDFCQFLTTFGSGRFPRPFYGNIYTPAEVYEACHGPMLMLLGSNAWASDNDQRRLYCSYGAFNPAPQLFTSDALTHGGISLLDLLQMGTDGSCGYHQLYVGSEPRPFGYCCLSPDGTMADTAVSFSEGLRMILIGHWREVHEDCDHEDCDNE